MHVSVSLNRLLHSKVRSFHRTNHLSKHLAQPFSPSTHAFLRRITFDHPFHSRTISSSRLRSSSVSSVNKEDEELPKLVFLGTPDLMRPSPEVDLDEVNTSEFQAKLDTLKKCMIKYGGIGIAGPQIGWGARVFCFGLFEPSARYPELNPDTLPFQHWINPQVCEGAGSRPSWFWEGCLSVPGMTGWVERPDTIVVEGFDHKGEKQVMELTGVAARVFQHEFDHLDGILFPFRVKKPTYLVPNAVFDQKDSWANDWPTPAARATPKGALCWEE